MIIAVDFDGTIAEHKYPDIGREVPGAFDWMKRWQAAGARLILLTMRADRMMLPDGSMGDGPVLTEAVKFCRDRGVEFWAVNSNPEQRQWTDSPKVYAHIYVDDAAFGCPLREPFGRGRPMVDWSIVGPAVCDRILSESHP